MDSKSYRVCPRTEVKPRFVFEGRDDHESYPSGPAPLSYGITYAPLPPDPAPAPSSSSLTGHRAWRPSAACTRH